MAGKSKRRDKRRRKASKLKASPGVTVAVKNYVKRAIGRDAETKMVTAQFVRPVAPFFSTTDLSVQPLGPLANGVVPGGLHIYNGTGFTERIGNTVRVKQLLVKYTMYPLPQNGTTNVTPTPQDVKVWIGFLRGNRTEIPTVAHFNDFFYVNNQIQSPQSSVLDMTNPVNAQLFTIRRTFRHKIGCAIQIENPNDPNIPIAHSLYSNNDYKYNVSRTVDCTKYINKVIKWSESQGPCDTGLYMWFEAVPPDGTQGVVNAYPIEVSGTITLMYEDA